MTGNPLLAHAEEVADRAHLEATLLSGKKLRVKFGIDPTAPDLHLGHAVVLRKLRAFQDAGHQAVLIIGDFTAMIGDPTGKSATRTPLTKEQVAANFHSYMDQARKILTIEKLEHRFNSEWLTSSLPEILALMRAASVGQALHRADFAKRFKEGNEISLIELVYPLLQGYDSVKIQADLELGGSDQLFNILMGRQVQREFGQPEQDIVTMPLLEGTDGTRKMSKSFGNYIGLNDAPDDMFGKIMSIPDALMPKYFDLLTDIRMPADLNPRDTKELLARTIVSWLHGAAAGESAVAAFTERFTKGQVPQNVPEWKVPQNPIVGVDLVAGAGDITKSEAKRLIIQGGAKIGGETITDPMAIVTITDGALLQIGKLKAFSLKI